MKTILLLNDFSGEAEHTLTYTTMLASAMEANVLIWNLKEQEDQAPVKSALVNAGGIPATHQKANWIEKADMKRWTLHLSEPVIDVLPEVDALTQNIAEIVYRNGVQLIVLGSFGLTSDLKDHLRPLLFNVHCPVLLVPKDFISQLPVNIVYLTDLRFCRREIIWFCKKLNPMEKCAMSIAHLGDPRLPKLNKQYATLFFNETISIYENNSDIKLYYINDSDVKKAVEVLAGTLKTDLLALSYNSFHFLALAGSNGCLSMGTSIPMLIFPS